MFKTKYLALLLCTISSSSEGAQNVKPPDVRCTVSWRLVLALWGRPLWVNSGACCAEHSLVNAVTEC